MEELPQAESELRRAAWIYEMLQTHQQARDEPDSVPYSMALEIKISDHSGDATSTGIGKPSAVAGEIMVRAVKQPLLHASRTAQWLRRPHAE